MQWDYINAASRKSKTFQTREKFVRRDVNVNWITPNKWKTTTYEYFLKGDKTIGHLQKKWIKYVWRNSLKPNSWAFWPWLNSFFESSQFNCFSNHQYIFILTTLNIHDFLWFYLLRNEAKVKRNRTELYVD